MRLVLLAAFAVALAPAASGQATQSEFERYAIAISNPCLQLQVTAESAADVAAKCEKTGADLMLLKSAVPDVAGHDLNVFHIVRGSVFARLARVNAILYGVKSQPVCGALESAWTHFAAFKVADSPSHEAAARQLSTSTVGEVKAGRAEFGAPDNATPLPQ
jgi:hypothetical protein